MQIRLAIFDFDGTVLNTLDDLHDSLNVILRRNELPERTLDETRRFVGNGIRKLIERAVPKGTDDAAIDRLFGEFLPYYEAHCAVKTAPYEGILPMLRALRGKGIKTAVVSNKADPAVQILCGQYFAGLFDAAAGETKEIARKPAPDMVNAVLERLSVPREAAVYIGDSDVDLETARNAKIPCIGVDWGFRGEAFLKAHGAKTIVYSPEELLPYLCGERGLAT